jgi:hypothetical protein
MWPPRAARLSSSRSRVLLGAGFGLLIGVPVLALIVFIVGMFVGG